MMKKYLLATLVAFTMIGTASATEVSVEGQRWDGKKGDANQTAGQLMVKQDVTKNFSADLSVTQNVVDNTNALSTRLELGSTGQYAFVPGVSAYVRGAVGEKYTNTTNFGYYSVEPGVVADVANTGAKVSLGWRYRDSFNDSNINKDQTRTWRSKVSYDVTKVDTVYVGYDNMRGDQRADIWRVGYTRSF